MLLKNGSFLFLSLLFLCVTWNSVSGSDNIDSPFNQQILDSHEIKSNEIGKHYATSSLSYFLDNQRSIIPLSTSPKFNKKNNIYSNNVKENNFYDLYGIRESTYSPENGNNLIDLPGKRKFIQLDQHLNDWIRRRSAFNGMRGKKVNLPLPSSPYTLRNSFGIYHWNRTNDNLIVKRARPFAAMLGKRYALRRARFYASRG
uniref:Uncharacterized protein n=1 Tax=Tetranychus urticae TaxID=32264 RepID=T1L068_TETUR